MRARKIFVLAVVIAGCAPLVRGASYTYDLTDTSKDYYTDPANAGPGVTQAISDATAWFANPAHNGDQITISFGSGTYTFICPTNATSGTIAIDVSNINPGASSQGVTGRLIIQGQGDLGASATNLLFTETITADGMTAPLDEIEFGGASCSHATFTEFHLGRLVSAPDGTTASVTQGTVVSEGTNTLNGMPNTFIDLDIPTGFPTPADVYDPVNFPSSGRFLRTFVYKKGVPQIKTVDETQISWQSYQNISTAQNPSRYELDGLDNTPGFSTGTILGIKSKHGTDSGRFTNVSDIGIDHIRWTDCTRVAFITNADEISITNCTTDRGNDIGGMIPCLASNEGGPQMNSNSNYLGTETNLIIANNTSVGQGDDAIALFNVTSATVSYNTLTDDWARGINLETSPNVITYDNTLVRCISIPAVLPNQPPIIDTPTLPFWGMLALGGLLMVAAGESFPPFYGRVITPEDWTGGLDFILTIHKIGGCCSLLHHDR